MTDRTCLNCGSDNTVPAWDGSDIPDPESEPDYLGCYDCGEMERLKDDAGPETGVAEQ